MQNKLYAVNNSPMKHAKTTVNGSRSEAKPTNSFISKADRFKIPTSNNSNPGPGTYQYPNHERSFISKAQKIFDGRSSSQYQWILDSESRSGFIPQNINRNLGPGSYDLLSSKSKSDHSSWTRSDRFSYNNTIKQQLGPGSYNYSDKFIKLNKYTGSSAFKSKVHKSYFQDLGKQKSLTKIINSPQKPMFYENPQINQERKVNIKKHDKKVLDHVFASKIPRFEKNKSNTKLGPGSYQIDHQTSHKSTLPKIITIHEKKIVKIDKSKERNVPGPGSYDVKQTLVQQLQNKGNPAIILRQQRFKQKKVEKFPGPGSYHQNKFMYMVDLHRKSPQSKVSFLSNSQRVETILPTKDNPFGNYNLQMYNLDYRLKKKKQHLDKLKIMQVQLPAFDSRSKK